MQMHDTATTAMLGDFAREIDERGKRRFMVGHLHGNKAVPTPLSM